jgi:hypothetical protein
MGSRPVVELRDAPAAGEERPRLLFFHSETSGRCRRVEGYLSQVLQRRHNHDTFRVQRVSVDERPDLTERLRIEKLPTLCVAEGNRIVTRVVAPGGCADLERALLPWLR